MPRELKSAEQIEDEVNCLERMDPMLQAYSARARTGTPVRFAQKDATGCNSTIEFTVHPAGYEMIVRKGISDLSSRWNLRRNFDVRSEDVAMTLAKTRQVLKTGLDDGDATILTRGSVPVEVRTWAIFRDADIFSDIKRLPERFHIKFHCNSVEEDIGSWSSQVFAAETTSPAPRPVQKCRPAFSYEDPKRLRP